MLRAIRRASSFVTTFARRASASVASSPRGAEAAKHPDQLCDRVVARLKGAQRQSAASDEAQRTP
jgi:hypothetical protein